MANFGFIIDNRRCIGCHACTVACKSEHEVPLGVNRTWVKYIEKGTFPQSRRFFSVMRCNHCDKAPCIEICPVTALFRRPDGIVDFDHRRCIGCKSCMQACPYDALYIDPEKHTAAKCNYCAHRIDRGLEPACVIVCPTQAIISGDLHDPNSRISILKSKEKVTARKTEKGTIPALFYIDADKDSLEPSATDSIDTSLWNNQVGGVGHYARFMEQRFDELGNAVRKRHPLDVLENLLDLGERNDGVLVPDENDPRQRIKASQVQHELSRRVYDTPNKGMLWGWQVSAYVWTKSIASGIGLITSLALVTGAATVTATTIWFTIAVALAFLGVTGFLLTIDLDQPARFSYVLLRPQWKSWLVRGAYILIAYATLLVAWAIQAALGFGTASGPVVWLLVPASAMTAVYTAFLFAQAKGRDFWQSPLLPLHMLVHAAIAGCAVLSFWLPVVGDDQWFRFLNFIFAVSLGAKLLTDCCELAITHSTNDAKRVARMITRGAFRRLYWLGAVLVGCVLPLLIALTASLPLMPVAGFMALCGLYVAEHIWVKAPQRIALS